MTKIHKIIALLFAALFMLGLTSCGNPQPTPEAPKPVPAPVQLSETYTNENLFEAHKKLSDGRTVMCVVYHEYQEGGIACDFAGAVRK